VFAAGAPDLAISTLQCPAVHFLAVELLDGEHGGERQRRGLMRRRVHNEPTTEPDLMRLTRVRSSHSFAFESDPRIALNTSNTQRLEQISRKKFSLLNLLE
jgi:hypothetical protein